MECTGDDGEQKVWAFGLSFRALSKRRGGTVIRGRVKTLGLMEWDLEMKPTHHCVTSPSQTLRLLCALGPGGKRDSGQQVGAGVGEVEKQ